MSLLRSFVRPSKCPSCSSQLLIPFLNTPTQQQTRHKRRSTRGPDNITVRLNKDVPGYGRAGAYVPISAGQMRNHWSRVNVAAYCTPEELRALPSRGITVRRDVLFMADAVGKRGKGGGRLGKRRQKEIDAAVRAGGVITPSPAPQKEVGEEEDGDGDEARERLAAAAAVRPRRGLELLGVLVPGRMDFGRRVAEDGKGIFGSVTLTDVVERVRDAMAHNDEASTVALAEENVRFVDVQGEDGPVDRVKELGQYKVEIRVQGAEGAVTRVIRVIPAEDEVGSKEVKGANKEPEEAGSN